MSKRKLANFHAYIQGELVIGLELSNEVRSGSLDYIVAKSLVDSTVKIVDDAILRMKNDE